jgi:NAD-dependent DNA ligase
MLEMTKTGHLTSLQNENKQILNQITLSLLNKDNYSEDDKKMIFDIIMISNILYTNYSSDILVLEDGIYDLLMEKCKAVCISFPVGGEPVNFSGKKIYDENTNNTVNYGYPIVSLDDKKCDSMLFERDIIPYTQMDMRAYYMQNTDMYSDKNHKTKDTSHGYPELVGTLNKCKYVLNAQAAEKGVLNDENVKVFERDFIGKQIQQGIINQNQMLEMVLSLKYDGVSVEGDIVGDTLYGARSRGDTENDQAMDITPILYGYKFPFASSPELKDMKFGMKFEAIMTKENLYIYNNLKQYNYKNCRTAITSIFNSIDGYMYRNLITLIPLQTSLDLQRLDEILFINRYYISPEQFRYSVIRGTYVEILFQVKKFVEEAEYLRSIIPFMYDGVVAEYTDTNLKNTLGRSNSVNQWAVAIKFNAMKKQTVFRGYSFTVGQNGIITPMIHYDPVEFFGTIHTKSTGHSYKRFMDLCLRVNDIIDVEYTNDVMPYVTKPQNNYNDSNQNIIVPFPTTCPSCGAPIMVSLSGKSALCSNYNCPERAINRVVSMIKKLNLKGFAEESVKKIAMIYSSYSLKSIVSLTKEQLLVLGEVNAQKFIDNINELLNKPVYDYKIMGSLGFEDIAEGKWKLILKNMTVQELISISPENLYNELNHIRGIGTETINTIMEELPYYIEDIQFIANMKNVIQSKGVTFAKIRFTGVRDIDLVNQLNDLGYDAGEGSVTKDTNILVVPNMNHNSSKVITAKKYGTTIMPINELRNIINSGLSLLIQ